ncbi:MAG TPA: hypothetical protein PLO61_06635 [Fimbriimonadaceae bacterium]|mgnify:CR=1 FL=1|nr:hypothetical protein [Fimbriimonadaceae bacterium]HRJ33230.1 hypothetical protein [Fimbriimonadaceae bacterium]
MGRLNIPPEIFWSTILTWILVVVWIVALVGWMVMGEVDVLSGLGGSCLAVALGFFSMNPPQIWVSGAIAMAMTVITLSVPAASRALNQFQLDQIEIEQAEKAYHSMLKAPQSVGMGLKLSQFLYQRGLVHHAAELLRSLLQGANPKVFADEFRQLRLYEGTAENSKAPLELRCLKCQHANPTSAMKCQNCGAAYLGPYIRRGWGMRWDLRKAIAVVLLLIMLGVTIPLSATSLPPGVGLGAVLVQIGLGGFIAFRAWITG